MTSRLKAAAIHGLISATLAAAVAAAVFLLWFPGDYSALMRGERLFTLIATCDVTLGPLLTLVIFNPAKSRRALLFDYSVVAALQVAALVYGASVVAQSRPVFSVFAIDGFEVVCASEVNTDPKLNESQGSQPASSWIQPSWLGPKLAILKIPANTSARNRALDLELQGRQLSGLPAYLFPYQPATALAKARPVAELLKRFADRRSTIEQAVQRAGLPLDKLVWLPAKTRFGIQTALLDAQAQHILAFVDLDPY